MIPRLAGLAMSIKAVVGNYQAYIIFFTYYSANQDTFKFYLLTDDTVSFQILMSIPTLIYICHKYFEGGQM